MKIAILNNLYFPHERGGAEKIAANLSRELTQAGHQVFTISTATKSYHSHNNYYLKSNYSKLKEKSWLYRCLWQINNLYNCRHYHQIKKIWQIKKPEMVITNNLMGLGLLIPRLIKKNKLRHIHILHDLQLLHPSGIILWKKEKKLDSIMAHHYQKQTRRLMGSPNLVISPSKWLLDLHQNHLFFPESETFVGLNPVMIADHQKTERDPNQFITIGQIEKSKGIPWLVALWKKLPQNLKLNIVGDGTQLDNLKKNTKRENIKFLGRLESDKIFHLLSESSALILPSLTYENSPNVIIEAASQDTPTIASHIGGIPELITRFGGTTFEPQNETELIAAINNHLENPLYTKKGEVASYTARIIKMINNN